MTLPLELAELLRRAIDDRLADVHTSLPGIVKSFNATDYTVDVEIGPRRPIKAWDDAVTYETPPVIPGVPVACVGTERTYVKTDLQAGDLVWLIFSELSASEFLDSGTASEPGDTSRHSLSSAIAIPFVRPGKVPSSPMASLGGSGAEALAVASKVQSNLNALVQAITAAVCGGPGSPLTWVPPTLASMATTEVKGK